MKHLPIALVAVASLILMTTVRAADDASSAQILQRLQALTQRLDRVEQENVALRAEIAHLKARAAEPAKEATVAKVADQPAAQAADRPDRIQIKGDVRYRVQQSDDERVAERDEHLLRARLSVEAKVNDSISAVVGIATSQGGNPRGANVQLDGEFSRKPMYLDLGYVDWTIARGLHAIGGKMKMPFARPGQSLFWDNDINPEGIAFTYANGSLFGSAYGFWVEENVQYAATASAVNDTTDTRMYGLQVGNRFKIGGSELMIAAMYYDLAAGQGRRPFFSGANGNSVAGPNGVLAEDFEVFAAQAEFNTRLGDLPL
jgi:cell division protein FtsB